MAKSNRERYDMIDEAAGQFLVKVFTRGVQARDHVKGGPLINDAGAPVYQEPSAAHVGVAIRFLQFHAGEVSPAAHGRAAGRVKSALERLAERRAAGEPMPWEQQE
jgi:hypothetical protein